MFGRSKPVVIEPYGRRRSRLPRWLLLLLVGIAAGAAGVIYVQERHLPPRLSTEASARLLTSFEQAERERNRLQGELEDTTKRLDASLAEKTGLADALAASRQTVEHLRADVAAAVAALPSDPRGGAVEVRAARFTKSGAALAYEVVLSRETARGKPFTGVMQFVVASAPGRGAETTLTLEPVPVSVAAHQVLRGSVPLPAAFVPGQCTVRVLDRPGGQLLGMRVLYVK